MSNDKRNRIGSNLARSSKKILPKSKSLKNTHTQVLAIGGLGAGNPLSGNTCASNQCTTYDGCH